MRPYYSIVASDNVFLRECMLLLKHRTARVSTALLALLAAICLLTCAPSRDADRPNVILIVIDALRAGNLGCYGHFRDTSPNIDAIAARGVLFETAITQAPWTKASFASFLSSRYPFQHGITDWNGVLPDSMETLADVLAREGYSTICVVNMMAMSGRFKVLKGFDVVDEAGRQDRAARRTTDDAIEIISASDGPFFLLLHYFDPHAPYSPPIEYADLVRRTSDPDPIDGGPGWRKRGGDGASIPSRERIDRTLLLYDGCIRFVDDNVGRLLAHLEENGIRDRTAIIVTADHGEEFYEHGVSGHGANVFDYAIKVPLIIDYPGSFDGGGRVPYQVRLVDIFPTVLGLAGVECGTGVEGYDLSGLAGGGEWPAQGSRLLPPEVALSECSVRRTIGSKCLRTDTWKAIVEPLTSLVELYNVSTDPDERENLWKTSRGSGEELLERLKDIPGISLGGWRLAFTGKDSETRIKVLASTGGHGRFTNPQRLTRGGELSVSANADSTQLLVEATLSRLHLILFETVPDDAVVRFEVEGRGSSLPGHMHIGGDSRHVFGESVSTGRDEALGLPGSFSGNRDEDVAGIYAWWLPGQSRRESARNVDLTPEEKSRLRALGYL
jgi:arylsulfatase A-like enzyme